jgi:hypothetical protein
MDKFAITGGTALQGRDPVLAVRRIRRCPRWPRRLLTEEPVIAAAHSPRARHPHHASGCWWISARQVDADGDTVHPAHTPRIVCRRSALRAGEDHARVESGAGAAGGPLRAGAGFSSREGAPSATRPINLHIFGLEKLGARIHQAHGYIEASAAGRSARGGGATSTASPSRARRTS